MAAHGREMMNVTTDAVNDIRKRVRDANSFSKLLLSYVNNIVFFYIISYYIISYYIISYHIMYLIMFINLHIYL